MNFMCYNNEKFWFENLRCYRKHRTHTRNKEVTTPRDLLGVGSPNVICMLSDISLIYFQYGDDEAI